MADLLFMPADELIIDIDLVTRLVATQFPQWKHLSIKPVEFGGWDNRTFHLGDHMTVRLPSTRAYAAQVEKEHRWLPRLGAFLPLPIPVPLAMGVPGDGYPWNWSVYRWLEGEIATIERISDLCQFAISLAQFLAALQRIDTAGGPLPGPHNFFRGGPLTVYDGETRQAIAVLHGKIDTNAATEVWEAALTTTWSNPGCLGPRRRQRRQPAGPGWPAERSDRLRKLGRGRSGLRFVDCVDVLRKRKSRSLPRSSSSR
jgi:aminoglycoside phosphotransferase (APT) family kinase protein